MKLRIWTVCAAFVPLTLTTCAAADAPVNTVSTRVTLTGCVMGYVIKDKEILLRLSDGRAYRMRPLWNQKLDVQPGDRVRVYADNNGNVLNVRNVRVIQRDNLTEPGREALQFSLATDKTAYGYGDRIQFWMTLHNNSDQPQQLTFNSRQWFDVVATLKGRPEPIWRHSQGQIFTSSIRKVTLKPGETLTFAADWERSQNSSAPRGQYTISADLAATNPIPASPIVIQLTH